MHVLVIEGEPKVAGALREGLEAEHYEVTVAHTGKDGFYEVSGHTFDLNPGLDVAGTRRA